MIGIFYVFMKSMFSQAEWYLALSITIIVCALQLALSLSNVLISSRQKMHIILASVLTWVKDAYRLPTESISTMRLSQGVTYLVATELPVPFACHFWRLKSIISSQVSSMLIITFFEL